MGCCSAIERNEVLIYVTSQMDLENICEKHKYCMIPFTWTIMEAESGLEVTRVELGAGEIENHCLKGTEFLLAVMKKKINGGDGCTT